MKKTMFFFLLLVGTVNAFAQTNYNYRGIPYESFSTNAESRFNSIKPGKLNVNFIFMYLNNGASFKLELSSIKQLYNLPNLDSIFTEVKNNLKLLADSLKDDGITRRVDYLGGKFPQVRISSFDSRPKSYTIKKGELNELKTEQDTLRIAGRCLSWGKTMYWEMGDKNFRLQPAIDPFFITLNLNSIADIYKLPDSAISICINRLKQDLSQEYVAKGKATASYSAWYNMKTNKMESPSNTKWIKRYDYRNDFVPNLYTSIQFPRGSFSPSLSFGARYTSNSPSMEKHFFLMAEWYFFFSHDLLNKLNTDVNKFLTFRYVEVEKKRKESFDFAFNLSLGYLIKRNGEWFDKSTFKLGLPAVRSGWLQLEPEFYFNNFFKNFSPTIKLTIHYE